MLFCLFFQSYVHICGVVYSTTFILYTVLAQYRFVIYIFFHSVPINFVLFCKNIKQSLQKSVRGWTGFARVVHRLGISVLKCLLSQQLIRSCLNFCKLIYCFLVFALHILNLGIPPCMSCIGMCGFKNSIKVFKPFCSETCHKF